MYCTAPLSPRKGRLISFHDDDDDDDARNTVQCEPTDETVFKSFLKTEMDDTLVTVGGRSFQMRAATAPNAVTDRP